MAMIGITPAENTSLHHTITDDSSSKRGTTHACDNQPQ